MNPLFHTDFSISDSLKSVRKNVLIYETIIEQRENGVRLNNNKSYIEIQTIQTDTNWSYVKI